MNRVGIFAKTFQRPTLNQVLDAVVSYGLSTIQLNLASAGLPTLPDELEPQLADSIAASLRSRQISVAAVSGTFNLIDPNYVRRSVNLKRLATLACFSETIGAPNITVSSGTRDPEDMWRAHPENTQPEVWLDMVHSFEAALAATEKHGIILAVEPEPANIVRTAVDARRLLNELQSERAKVLLDGANLVSSEPAREQRAIFSEAVDVLGTDIALVHAKEYVAEGESAPRVPGRGSLDWSAYVGEISRSGYRGPFILHGHPEQFTHQAVEFIHRYL